MLIFVWPLDVCMSDHTSRKWAKRRCFLCLCLSPRGNRSNGFGKLIKLCFEWCRLGTLSVFPGASLAEPGSLQAFVPQLGFCQTPLLQQSCSELCLWLPDIQTAWLAAFSSQFCCFSSHAQSDLLCFLTNTEGVVTSEGDAVLPAPAVHVSQHVLGAWMHGYLLQNKTPWIFWRAYCASLLLFRCCICRWAHGMLSVEFECVRTWACGALLVQSWVSSGKLYSG